MTSNKIVVILERIVTKKLTGLLGFIDPVHHSMSLLRKTKRIRNPYLRKLIRNLRNHRNHLKSHYHLTRSMKIPIITKKSVRKTIIFLKKKYLLKMIILITLNRRKKRKINRVCHMDQL